MAKTSGVTLTVDGLSGVTPVGVSIVYAVGSIPTAVVDLAPDDPGTIKIAGGAKGVLADVDQQKRGDDITIAVSVESYNGDQGKRKASLSFVGLLDGLSIGNVVGGNTYQAIIKNKAQVLLELTTHMPGLYPSSVNIYRNPMLSVTRDITQPDQSAVIAWGQLIQGEVLKKQPIEFYTGLMKKIIEKQEGGWVEYCGRENLADGELAFKKIFEDARYKKALGRAKKIFENVDLSAVNSGSAKNLLAGSADVNDMLASLFTQGSTILLENYMNFLAFMGCTVIFSNSKMYVVPINSVIRQDLSVPNKGELPTEPNRAYPASYNSYMYNDNGFRDIAHVIISAKSLAGPHTAADTIDRGAVAHFSEEDGLSNASGIYVVNAHPFMAMGATSFSNKYSEKPAKKLEEGNSMLTEVIKYESCVNQVQTTRTEAEQTRTEQAKNSIKDVVKNYAETKFYQARYGDRTGSITMDFNPDWVPGTSGWLFVRETGMFVVFYVTTVTHRVDMGPPATGTAITTINFVCGRMGTNPPGIDKDLYLGYDLGKEQDIQHGFISDNS
jgi:hypothetical protein